LQQTTTSVALVHQWLEECVIGLSLCPFASAPYKNNQVRVAVFNGTDAEAYLQRIADEIASLFEDQEGIETTLVVAENALPEFLDFNDFLHAVEQLIEEHELDHFVQLASFHPQYLFAGSAEDDAANFTNRAPYPIVQLLRVATVSRAVDSTDTMSIPEDNIKRLQELDTKTLRRLFPWS